MIRRILHEWYCRWYRRECADHICARCGLQRAYVNATDPWCLYCMFIAVAEVVEQMQRAMHDAELMR